MTYQVEWQKLPTGYNRGEVMIIKATSEVAAVVGAVMTLRSRGILCGVGASLQGANRDEALKQLPKTTAPQAAKVVSVTPVPTQEQSWSVVSG